MADSRVGQSYTLESGENIEVTEEDQRKVYFTVEGVAGTHSLPAHSFDDMVGGSSSSKSSSSSSSTSRSSSKES